MSPRRWELRLTDILDAMSRIEGYVDGLDVERFCQDPKTRDAVVCNLEIIGEASHHLDARIKANIPGVDWPLLYSLRVESAHQYFRREDKLIWNTIMITLPPIQALIQTFLSQAGPNAE